MTETQARIALNMLPGMGPIGFRKLLEALGSARAILGAKFSELRKVREVRIDALRRVASWESQIDLSSELERIRADGVEILDGNSPHYPPLLKNIPDPPIVLYVLGNLQAQDAQGIGVVGTRTPSTYGRETGKKLAYQLAAAGLTVVSGLARGIDTDAHMAALAAKGRTLAVLGSGLRRIYPRENRPLAERIAAGHGAVLSEYPMETLADRRTFPMRNRIIAGATFGLLVIEAGQQSGAMISASQACDFGRSVYAIPGRIDQPMAMGTNRLIQQGAKLIVSAKDILDELGLLFKNEPVRPRVLPDLTQEESAVLNAVDHAPTHVDQVIRSVSFSISETMVLLFKLEIKRLLKQLPGQHYIKTL